MKVQFTTPTAGRELNEVADLPDHEAEFLLRQGAVRRPGSSQPAQGFAAGNPNLAVVREQDPHTDVPDEDEDEREIDVDERANAQSGKGDQSIPQAVLDGDHPFEGEPVNPFEEGEQSAGGLDGMSARELKSYIERINEDDPEAKLSPLGNKQQLRNRVADYQAQKAEHGEQV